MTQKPQTYSSAHLRRHRDAHARTDGYGRHRHLYLHALMQQLAARLRQSGPARDLTWLDYGCGKGGFVEEIRPLGLFASITGHDPAVEAFRARPEGRFDLVTCLDVIDVVEPQFLDALIADVAAFTGGLALFDCLTMPSPAGGLRPHKAFYWAQFVRRHMDVLETRVEFPGMQDFERVVLLAAPRPAP